MITEEMNMKNMKLIGMICLFVGIIVQVLWGFIGNAWGISWIASFVGVMLMVIFNLIAKYADNNK